MGYTFHHVHVRCEDVEAAVAYYEKMLNGEVTERVERYAVCQSFG